MKNKKKLHMIQSNIFDPVKTSLEDCNTFPFLKNKKNDGNDYLVTL